MTKKRPKLAKQFKCPFCANDDVVECKMDLKAGVGSLACRLCGASYSMPIHHLHEPVDVFSEWLDDCESAQNPSKHQQQEEAPPRYPDEVEEEEEDDDDDLPQASGLHQSSKSGARPQDNKKRQASINLGSDDSDDDQDDDE